ncbi:TrbI/VirB10 family protein [Geomonas anaerohicana]|uniref:TrbI/VirB10 family protein n=1 Tax=Geomonas anaerohicana TaxID=2798583 RepID=A0ABS0YCC4_9BACT|nr:TrbI/VirB10 family protein [Geomonas anaerohicana]MBJ6749931.1 TrbI/VirB10 family protein [Geomonas anaerohicana]
MVWIRAKAEPEQDSPLKTPRTVVTRFNRRMIFVLAVVITVIITAAVVASFSPKKMAQGEEKKSGQKLEQAPTSPGLPDPMVTAPGSYDKIPKARSASGGVPSPRKPAEAAAEAAAGDPPQPVSPAYTVTPPGQLAENQTQKDKVTAINSPVTFGQGEIPQPQARAEEPHLPVAVPHFTPTFQPGERLPPDDQNMQGEKRDFSRERQQDLPYLKSTLMAPISQYEIKAGTILPATLITGINSDLPGQIVAQMRENVFDTVTGNYLLVPQGTRLIGEYDSKVAFGQERVLVVWTRLVMPNGESVNLEGMPGTDLSGYAGMTGRVNNHYGKLVTGVVLGSVIGAGAQVAVGGQGAPNVPPTFGNLAVSGAAQNINQAAQQHTNKVLNMQPSIEVSPGDKINVFVTKDMILKPFTE